MHQASTIRAACESGRGHHHNIRDLGAAMVLPKAAEVDIVLWLNTLRKDGSPVSRVMLQLQAMHLAKEHDLEDKFAACSTWVNWGDLSIDTIVSGFAKVGILTDTRVAEAMPTEDAPQIESCIVEELENCNLVDGEFGSDDDIENESDSDDESNL
ncbi:unnamed protein product [Phytophthora fragariaefolia]|uniref:Unnamed protein product n=1 Tax=Phytophthora fragariaefolia TaxID=1490495 RepID=A0A9W7CY69_9STRA|nr:unnamed protein product [Phytophthora fragariaefolia]